MAGNRGISQSRRVGEDEAECFVAHDPANSGATPEKASAAELRRRKFRPPYTGASQTHGVSGSPVLHNTAGMGELRTFPEASNLQR